MDDDADMKTQRFIAAALAMHALLLNADAKSAALVQTNELIAKKSVAQADALIAELAS